MYIILIDDDGIELVITKHIFADHYCNVLWMIFAIFDWHARIFAQCNKLNRCSSSIFTISISCLCHCSMVTCWMHYSSCNIRILWKSMTKLAKIAVVLVSQGRFCVVAGVLEIFCLRYIYLSVSSWFACYNITFIRILTFTLYIISFSYLADPL